MAPGRISNFFHKLNPEVLFGRSHAPSQARTLFFNQPLPKDYRDPKKGKVLKKYEYTTNQVITSKYTVITFLPRNLLEQFRRIANIFFAAIAILQFFPRFSTISPGLVIIPLLAVLSITALKDGYEDVKRHQSDRRVNHSETHILAAPNWTNPNATGKKSRTFVRGIIKKRPGKLGGEKQAVDVEKGVRTPETNDSSTPTEDADGEFGWKDIAWEDLRAGDFVRIRNNEHLPADIVICATSEEENVAFVETKNLDGETNLKSRNAVSSLTALRSARACADPNVASFQIHAEAPDDNMYKLNGKVVMPDDHSRPQPIDLQTVLLRGSVLRNTQWVIGVVLYTGLDTKVVMNSSGAPSKRSKVEKQMNPQVLINLLLLTLMAVVCAIVEARLDVRYTREGAPWTFDENTGNDNPNINGLATWANALITFQNVVPISLYISIEVVRTLQAAFIFFDHEIYYEKTDTATLARSWNLSDDLGQIEYVFSDKTGTLTQNLMVFRHCTVGGKVYKGDAETESTENVTKSVTRGSGASSEGTYVDNTQAEKTAVPSPPQAEKVGQSPGTLGRFHDSVLQADIQESMNADSNSSSAKQARILNGFFNVLALCHTVIASVDPKTGAIEYKAQSPDEAALVQAAADSGFVFRGRDREILKLQTPFADQVEEYELLHVLEFNSTRKRMSVIVRKMDAEDNRIFLMTKGADNVIFERLKPGQDDIRGQVEEDLNDFANEGLRTLCLAYKVLPDEQYETWSQRYHEATVAIENREATIDSVSEEIEKDLRLLGATAIEDRLQDGVPETIADLKRAGIKVWVATGDKLETAIAIGYSTNLIGKDSNLIVVRGGRHPARSQLVEAGRRFFGEEEVTDEPETAGRRSQDSTALRRTQTGVSSLVGNDNGERPGGFVLVIDGLALQEALEDENKEVLLRISTKCEAVVCCRVSPLQKALVVRLVKDGLNAVTLAIGDGANDVSMIQAAHVGVGISGEEGLQAVNSSDYAIAQFRFLKRLLLVHGHWSYARNANMIVNFFYKNIVCIGVLWWFQIYCAWSTQYVFDYTYLLFWNVFWSLATVIAIGIFDRFIGDDVLMALPELYRSGREGRWFGIGVFSYYMIDAVYQSVVIFFFCTYAYESISSRTDGFDVSKAEYSTTMVFAAVMVVNAFNGLNTAAWTGWVFFAVTIGPILVWLFTIVYSDIAPGWFVTAVFGNNHYLFRSAYFWLCNIFAFILCILPRYVVKAAQNLYYPTDIDIIRSLQKFDPHIDVQNHPLLGGRFKRSPSPTNLDPDVYRSPAFSQSRRSLGSRTDMATGLAFVHRGFGFTTEENGVSMRRMQSNLSGRQAAKKHGNGHDSKSRLFPSLRKSLRRRKTNTPPDTPPQTPPAN